MVVMVVGSMYAAFLIYQPTALAYAVPSGGQLPMLPGGTSVGSSQGYSFGNSFGNLTSPFQNFFNSMKGGNAHIPVNMNIGGNNVSSTIIIGINVQQYIHQYVQQFDAWFYGLTGVHIEWLINLIIGIFYWIFHVADSIVRWIAGLFH